MVYASFSSIDTPLFAWMILDQGVNAAAAMIPVVPDLKIPGMLEQARGLASGPPVDCGKLKRWTGHNAHVCDCVRWKHMVQEATILTLAVLVTWLYISFEIIKCNVFISAKDQSFGSNNLN
jgi:hypothetical protein